MEDVILTEEDAIGYFPPEPVHVDTVFQGVVDTVDQQARGVAGVESLTSAQNYLQSTLAADGLYSLAHVNGSEGFISNVGAGIKKAWDYIVKMFKSLWEFFFKRDNKAKADAAQSDVAAGKMEIAKLGGNGVTEEETNKQLHNLKEAAVRELNNEAADSSTKREMQEVVDAVDAVKGKPQAEKKQAVAKEARRFAKASTQSKRKLQDRITDLGQLVTEAERVLGVVVDECKKQAFPTEQINTMLRAQHEFIAAKNEVTRLPSAQDPESAVSVIAKLGTTVENIKKANIQLSSDENAVKQGMSEIQASIGNGELTPDQKKRMEFIRMLLTAYSRVAQLSLRYYDGVSNATKLSKKLLGQ